MKAPTTSIIAGIALTLAGLLFLLDALRLLDGPVRVWPVLLALLSLPSLHAAEYFTGIVPLAGGPVTARMNPGTR
jgi:hypothetical protein